MNIIRALLSSYLTLLFITAACFFTWRYWPVKIQVSQLERVDLKRDTFDKIPCTRFQMTPAKFVQKFAMSQRLFAMEMRDYGFGSCYYKAEVDGVEYRIWVSGLAEVRRGSDVQFYTSRERLEELN